ncbi:MAG TPA: hypothetical protein VJ724_08325 [Tahibacter sp.]|nr:hypothetical protein [Tahibacter sp.]
MPAVEPAVAEQAQSLVHAARHFYEGAAALAANRPLRGGVALAFLAAQAVEYALKGFLLSRGETPDRLKNAFRHDLHKLWTAAAQHGLPIAAPPPHWCELLNRGHNTPFRFKFPEYLGAIVTPGPDQVVAGVEAVLCAVSASMSPHATSAQPGGMGGLYSACLPDESQE